MTPSMVPYLKEKSKMDAKKYPFARDREKDIVLGSVHMLCFVIP